MILENEVVFDVTVVVVVVVVEARTGGFLAVFIEQTSWIVTCSRRFSCSMKICAFE